MPRSRCARFALTATLLLSAQSAAATDWPGWLGPNGDGSASVGDVFAAAEPALAVTWNKPLGKAYSGISVAGQKAVTMFADGETDWLVALDVATGEELWRYRIDDMFPKIGGAHGGQLSTPVIDGDSVYGLGAKGQLFAVALADGKERWSLRIDEKLGARQPHFGFTTTPLVVGELLFVQTGGADGHSLTGFAKKSGEVAWATGGEVVGYQSPSIVELAGESQIIAVTNASVAGLRPADGEVLWRHEHGLVPSRDGWATPIRSAGGSFVLTGQSESAAFRIAAAKDGFEVKELWRADTVKGNFAMPVAHDGHLYGYDGNSLACVDGATGASKWTQESDAAGLILVDGHLVIFDSDGSLVVVAASPKGYRERARLQVVEEGGFTFPSFADGGFFVRNLERIARVDVAAKD